MFNKNRYTKRKDACPAPFLFLNCRRIRLFSLFLNYRDPDLAGIIGILYIG